MIKVEEVSKVDLAVLVMEEVEVSEIGYASVVGAVLDEVETGG